MPLITKLIVFIRSVQYFSLWLNVIDHDLNFLFEPIEFKTYFKIKTIPFKRDGQYEIFCLLKSRKKENIFHRIKSLFFLTKANS